MPIIAAVHLIHLAGGISTGDMSAMASLFSITRLSASMISNGTRYFKGRFKVSILSQLRRRTFISASLTSLQHP